MKPCFVMLILGVVRSGADTTGVCSLYSTATAAADPRRATNPKRTWAGSSRPKRPHPPRILLKWRN